MEIREDKDGNYWRKSVDGFWRKIRVQFDPDTNAVTNEQFSSLTDHPSVAESDQFPVDKRVMEFERFASVDASDRVDIRYWQERRYQTTITTARYGGGYEGGAWIAFPYAIAPNGAWEGDDLTTMDFWQTVRDRRYPIGTGASPQEALTDLIEKAAVFLDDARWDDTIQSQVRALAKTTSYQADRILCQYVHAVCDHLLEIYKMDDTVMFKFFLPDVPPEWGDPTDEAVFQRWKDTITELRNKATAAETALSDVDRFSDIDNFLGTLGDAIKAGLLWHAL